jgi:hypothetical protein
MLHYCFKRQDISLIIIHWSIAVPVLGPCLYDCGNYNNSHNDQND